MFGEHTPTQTNSVMGGTQHKFQFANGYGASVVCHQYSYGGTSGLWELAVIGADGRLNYETPVTNDVLGHLSEAEVAEAFDEIQALGPAEVSA